MPFHKRVPSPSTALFILIAHLYTEVWFASFLFGDYNQYTRRKTGKFHLCAPLSTFDAAHSTLWSLSVEEPKEEPILPGFLLTPKVCNK